MPGSIGRFGLFWQTLNIWKLISDPVYRSSRWLYLTAPDKQQQVTTYTEADRYPLLFGTAREALGDSPELRLLSYGCSTGEEVSSLRRLFSEAELMGVDINQAALRVASRSHGGPRIEFAHSSAEAVERRAPFDAVFCMAVLQRFPTVSSELDDIAAIYPFDQFRSQVERLHALIDVGGLLVLHLTSYRFADLPFADRYEVIPSEVDRPWYPVVFNPDGSRVRRPYKDVIFRRVRA